MTIKYITIETPHKRDLYKRGNANLNKSLIDSIDDVLIRTSNFLNYIEVKDSCIESFYMKDNSPRKEMYIPLSLLLSQESEFTITLTPDQKDK